MPGHVPHARDRHEDSVGNQRSVDRASWTPCVDEPDAQREVGYHHHRHGCDLKADDAHGVEVDRHGVANAEDRYPQGETPEQCRAVVRAVADPEAEQRASHQQRYAPRVTPTMAMPPIVRRTRLRNQSRS